MLQFDACVAQKLAAVLVGVVAGVYDTADTGIDQHLGAG